MLKSLQHLVGSASQFCFRLARGMILGCMVAMSTVIIAQVFGRYALHRSIPWSEELARYLMIWMSLVGASVAFRQGSHVAITFLRDRLEGGKRRIVDLLGMAVIGVFLYILIREGLGLAWMFMEQKSPAMGISMVWAHGSIFVAGVFMGIHWLHRLLESFGPSLRPHPLARK